MRARFVFAATVVVLSCGCDGQDASLGDDGRVCDGTYRVENLDDLTEVQSCREVTGDLIFADFSISELRLPKLQVVGGNLSIYPPELGQLSLPSLGRVGGDLGVSNCRGLTNLEGLSALKSVGTSDSGSIRIAGLDLTDVSGLRGVTSIPGRLQIDLTEALTDLAGLGNLISAGSLVIENNQVLATLDGITGITLSDSGADLAILSNLQLHSVILRDVQEVGGDVLISGNPALVTIELDTLEAVGDLGIDNNAMLPGVALPLLASASSDIALVGNAMFAALALPMVTCVGESLIFVDNPMLTDLELANLSSIGANLEVRGSASLPTTGLFSLTSVGGSVLIGGNAQMAATGLSALETVGPQLLIANNAGLAELDLGAVTHVGELLQITDNPVLPACDVVALIAQLQEFTGSIDRWGNHEPCYPNPCAGGACVEDCTAPDEYTCN